MRLRSGEAKRWPPVAERSLSSSRMLFAQGEFRGSVNRSYYAVYQLATALSVEHGDAFANEWNNPSHDQLPGLVKNNKLLSVSVRGVVARSPRQLRLLREDADYRPGHTIQSVEARTALLQAEAMFELLDVKETV